MAGIAWKIIAPMSASHYHLAFGLPGDELDAHGMPMPRAVRLYPSFRAVLLELFNRDKQGMFFSPNPLVVRYGIHPNRELPEDGRFVVRLGPESTEFDEARRGNQGPRPARGLLEYRGHFTLDETALRGWSFLMPAGVPPELDDKTLEGYAGKLIGNAALASPLFLKLVVGGKLEGLFIGDGIWALARDTPEGSVVMVRWFSLETGIESMRALMEKHRGLKWRFPRSARRDMHRAAVELGVGVLRGREEMGWTEVEWAGGK